MIRCPSCGYENAAGIPACERCGIQLAAPAENNPTPGTETATPLEVELLALLRGKQKIAAIKLYRSRNRCGLKEAKDAVETLARKHGVEQGTGCGAAVGIFIGILVFIASRL
jgi:ribosomal protein L7/L12